MPFAPPSAAGSANQRAAARPALRPILPKPPTLAPKPPAPAPAQTPSTAAPVGARVLGSVASSIFSGSSTITLPPRPSASRAKTKKRASPDRVVPTPTPSASSTTTTSSSASPSLSASSSSTPATSSATLSSLNSSSTVSPASTLSHDRSAEAVAAALKKRRRAKISENPVGSKCTATGALSPAATAAALSPRLARVGLDSSSSTSFDVGDILSPEVFSLPQSSTISTSSWWTDSLSLDSSHSSSPSSTNASAIAAAAAASRRRLERASSTTSSITSSTSTAYFSDSTVSTGVSSILIDDDSSKRAESEISEMIHRLITGDGVPYEPKSMEVRRSSLASLEDEEDEMLFATEIDTSSVRQLRGGNSKDLAESKRSLLTSSIIKPNIGVSSVNASSTSASTLQDPIRSALATSSPAASTSSSSYSNAPSPVSTPYSATTATTAAATPIPSPKPNYRYRGSSEPASITIPAEKNSYEEDTEAEFMRNRELLVQKGVCSTTAGKTHRAHPFGKSNADSGIIFASALTSGTPSGSATRAGRVFGEDEEDEMISSTTSHDEIRSMDIDIDADIDDINGSSEALFGGLDSLGVNIDDDDPFTFLDVGGNEVVESVCY